MRVVWGRRRRGLADGGGGQGKGHAEDLRSTGDEAPVHLAAVEIHSPDSARAVIPPVDLRAVDRDCTRAAGPGDEGRVDITAVDIGLPDRPRNRTGPVDVRTIDRD